jgi:hypothetical protein
MGWNTCRITIFGDYIILCGRLVPLVTFDAKFNRLWLCLSFSFFCHPLAWKSGDCEKFFIRWAWWRHGSFIFSFILSNSGANINCLRGRLLTGAWPARTVTFPLASSVGYIDVTYISIQLTTCCLFWERTRNPVQSSFYFFITAHPLLPWHRRQKFLHRFWSQCLLPNSPILDGRQRMNLAPGSGNRKAFWRDSLCQGIGNHLQVSCEHLPSIICASLHSGMRA